MSKRSNRRKQRLVRRKAPRNAPPEPLPAQTQMIQAELGRTRVHLSDAAMEKIVALVEGDPRHECGAFLIGNLLVDPVSDDRSMIAFVDDVYTDGKYGGGADYTFTASMQTDAAGYIFRTYGFEKHMIGTVHSHAQFDSFFSSVDHTMMEARRSNEVHMVISPSHGTYVLTFKNSELQYDHSVELVTGREFPYRRNTR